MEGTPIAVFLVILVLIVIFVYFVLPRGPSQKESSKGVPPPSHTSQNSSAPPAQNSPGYPTQNISTSQASKNSSSAQPAYCLSNSSSVWVSNGNFSTGTYYGWSTTGKGFGTAPFNITSANRNGTYYGSQWSNYNNDGSEFFATTYSQSRLIEPGTLSTSFVAVEPYLNFQIISPQNPAIYVQISYDGRPEIVEHYNTSPMNYNMSTFADESINMTSLLCKSVTLSIVANVSEVTSSDQNQFVAVANVYQGSTPSR